jgi:hypothetical protein
MADAAFRDYRRFLRGVNQFFQMVRCDCINGYALGRKVTQGKVLSQLAIQIFVNEKLSLRRLPLANRIPKTVRIPDDRAAGGVLEFTTDVISARFNSLENTSRLRPAPSGISIGHRDITAGTLGGLVRDTESGKTVILSNNHVLGNSNEGSPGDAILQPGPADGGSFPADHIADLTRFVEIDFIPGSENLVDAAIATPRDPSDVVWNTVDIGPGTPARTHDLDESDLGAAVHKTGRTTEHTRGFVQALFGTTQVKYDLFKKATFVDQIIVSQAAGQPDFSNGGDSGSLVYDDENRCVGLLFAGSQGTENQPGTTILNPIAHVLRLLEVELLTPGSHPTGDERAARERPPVEQRPTPGGAPGGAAGRERDSEREREMARRRKRK